MTAQPKQSRWLPDKSGYVTPDGEVVRLWNGPMLWYSYVGRQKRKERDHGNGENHANTGAG